MPDIIDVSDLLEAVVIRVARHHELSLSETVLTSDSLIRAKTENRSISQTVSISDELNLLVAKQVAKSLTETVPITEQLTASAPIKRREISETTTLSETLQAYKNDVELIPITPIEIPTPQNIIGTRQFKARAVPRPPRAIIIDEIKNVAIAALKLLAFSDSNNKAIVGIRLRPSPNVTRVSLIMRPPNDVNKSLAYSAIKTQPEPMMLKARLGLPLSSLYLTTAKLKLRPQVQTMHAVKAVNFERMHKLTRIMKIAMLAESL